MGCMVGWVMFSDQTHCKSHTNVISNMWFWPHNLTQPTTILLLLFFHRSSHITPGGGQFAFGVDAFIHKTGIIFFNCSNTCSCNLFGENSSILVILSDNSTVFNLCFYCTTCIILCQVVCSIYRFFLDSLAFYTFFCSIIPFFIFTCIFLIYLFISRKRFLRF